VWGEWTDHSTGEVLPTYSMLTCNCDEHPLLKRLHKPDPKLPPDAQDKRSVIHVAPEAWDQWLSGTVDDALELIRLEPAEAFAVEIQEPSPRRPKNPGTPPLFS